MAGTGATSGGSAGSGASAGRGGSGGGGTTGEGGEMTTAGEGGGGPGPVKCAEGTANCDDNPDCEADLTSPDTCGSCSNHCSYDHADATCKNGKCAIGKCAANYDDCNGDPDDGCEASLKDPKNCGECGNRCNGNQTCTGGRCSDITCPDGKGNCDSDSSNGCETDLNTLSDCGMCGRACSVDNGSATCDSGTCQVDKCDDGWGDCDNDRRNGCEAPLTTVGNCGTCGNPCRFDNSEASCETGTCTFVDCEAGYADCNTDVNTDGCETAINTATDCGTCGHACAIDHAQVGCDPSGTTFTCAFRACEAGWVDVNQDTTDGCECADLPSDAGTSCQTAKDLGSMTVGTLKQYVGTVPVPTKSDWYKVTIPAASRSSVNAGFMVHFAAATSSVYRLEIVPGCGLGDYSCGEASQTTSSVTTWEFGDSCQGGVCNQTNTQAPTAAYIRVFRTGTDLSCDQYTLELKR